MADVFNNPSNDYIYPGLAPCPGVADDQYLRWTTDGMSIIKGSEIISTISFDDIAIPVSSFSKEQRTLGPGEVTFVAGLSKGLCKRNQGFTMPSLVSTNESLNPLFLNVDLSLNYYQNFAFKQVNIEASSNYGENINIQDALNLALNSIHVKITANYDVSALTFQGTQDGYEYNISNVSLEVIDASENAYSPFPNEANANTYLLTEDLSLNISSAKYPNSAMQGIVLRGIYPGSPVCEWDKWIWVNHVTDYVTICEPIEIENYITDTSTSLVIEFDSSSAFGCGVTEPSINEPAYVTLISPFSFENVIIDGLIVDDSSIIGCLVIDSSISNSNMDGSNNITTSNIYNSYVSDSSIYYSTIESLQSNNTEIGQSTILFINANETFFGECSIGDADPSAAITTISGGSIINNNSYVVNALIENSWVNAYRLFVGVGSSGNIYEYVTDDETIPLDTSLWTVTIEGTEIWDSSINNAIVNDCSIFRTYLEDVSLNNCTLYNPVLEPSTYSELIKNNRVVMIDPSIDFSFELSYDSSTFLKKVRKKLEIGMSGCSTESLMSAGDYLEWVSNNDMWKKVGDIYIWTSSPDPDSNCSVKNLIDGFYVFNPHDFDVQIEYMVFV